MPLGFTLITALCLFAVVLIALIMAFYGEDATRSMDDVYARRNSVEPQEDPTETVAHEPVSLTERSRATASTFGGRSDAPQSQQDAA